MGAGHQHAEQGPPRIRIGRWPSLLVLALIAICGVSALLGVVQWWPDGARVDHLRGLVPVVETGVEEVHGEFIEVQPICTSPGENTSLCGHSEVRIIDGRAAGKTESIDLTPDIIGTGLSPGDRVLVLDTSGVTGGKGADFQFYRADRGGSLLWLAVLFAILVVLVAWRRGIMALVSLGFAALVVIGFLLPALLSGRPPIPVTLSASILILILMLYATHGLSIRTSVALLGALLGVGLSSVFAWFGIIGSRLAGVGDESAGLLTFNVPWVSVQQLVVASVILAGLGTLNDVTITQVSALWELREASPTMTRRTLFRRAMRIGRDHVASTVYTLVFAYLGTSLVLLVAVQLYGGTPYDFATAENVAEEIVRALVGGIALVLAMPITTGIAILVVGASSGAVDRPLRRRSAQSPRYARQVTGLGASTHEREDPTRRFPTRPWDED